MPLKIYDSIEPAGNFKVTGAKNVWTEDGKSVEEALKEKGLANPEAAEVIEPDMYYTFGEVESLAVELAETSDGRIHEYCFEFIPKADFGGLVITPEPKWAAAPQFPEGKTCQVSIVNGIGVMIRA